MSLDPNDLIASLENFIMRLKAGEFAADQAVVILNELNEDAVRVFHWGPGNARDARRIAADGLFTLQTIGLAEIGDDFEPDEGDGGVTVH